MTATSVRDRITATAFDLFYRQGYRATGINQIIAESGVAKASFYAQFQSKEDLLVEYLKETARKEIADTRAFVEKASDARERFFAPLDILTPWLASVNFRGCPFQNIVAEAPCEDPRVGEVAKRHHDNLRVLLRELSYSLIQTDKKLKHLDPDQLGDQYLVLFEGCIVLAVAYQSAWPIETAREAVERLIS